MRAATNSARLWLGFNSPAGLVGVICALAQPSSQAAVFLHSTQIVCPHPGLASFTISAVGTQGEIINRIAGLDVSRAHHVTPAFGQPTATAAQWESPNGAGDPAWKIYDTYVLLNPSDPLEVVGFIGSAQERNDGSNPANLSLSHLGFDATVGMGTLRFGSSSDSITVTPAAASSNLAFLQLLLTEGRSSFLNVTVFDTTGKPYQVQDYPLGFPDRCVPEPASAVIASIGLIGVLGFSRYRVRWRG